MNCILTSDWQAEFGNLAYCEQALEEIIRSAANSHTNAIIFAGDQKEHYNPVDTRVVLFWARAIKRLRDLEYRVIIMLGNHDRISQSMESKNWLPILRSAGAEVVTKPKVKVIHNTAFAFIPYTSSREQEKEWAEEVRINIAASTPKPSVLIFHTDVTGAALNSAGRKAEGASLDALHLDQYTACFGGHLHGHQKVTGNTWYIGSPFCHGWDEANQPKGHLHIWSNGKGEIGFEQIRTQIPGWYEADWLEARRKKCGYCWGTGFTNSAPLPPVPCKTCSPEPGALIRSRVAVTSRKITEQLRIEDDRLKAAFEGARTLVVPKLIAEKAEVDLSGATDVERIEQYVTATLPEAARFKAVRAVRYIADNLAASAQIVNARELRYIRMVGENVLSFKKIDVKYDGHGLVLLKGENQDWMDEGTVESSNGAGKTSFLSLLPIAEFGQNPKGQKHDNWAREHTKAPATLRLVLRDDRNRKLEIIRGRRLKGGRPAKLEFRIDGEDVSTGLRSAGKQETQGLIEREIGQTLPVLMNSVYIDQTIANGFLFGTQKEKMDLVSRLEDLTKYDTAQKAIGRDITQLSGEIGQLTKDVESLRTEIDNLRADRKEYAVDELDSSVFLRELKEAEKAVAERTDAYQGIKGTETFYKELETQADALEHDTDEALETVNTAKEELAVKEAELERIMVLVNAGQCGKCGQAVEESNYPTKRLHKTIKALRTTVAACKESREKSLEKLHTLHRKVQNYEEKLEEAEQELAEARVRLASAQTAEAHEQKRRLAIQAKKKKVTTRLREAKAELKTKEKALAKLDIKLEMAIYASEAMHRSGMPLYLCSALCEKLNRFGEEYSELFWDGKVKVLFQIEDGELTAKIVNPAGSSKVEGQSMGECAMAGCVTAFALREAGMKTNLLVLDEPGANLDAERQKQFAKGLMRLRDSGKFSTIIITTHSTVIQGMLEGETTWRIVKKNRRSKLVLNEETEKAV